MNAIVFEHVPLAELPPHWQARLAQSAAGLTNARVTVHIEAEPLPMPPAGEAEAFVTDDPAFGIWRDREDMVDVEAYVRRMRAPRFNRDGSRKDE